jgi:DNA integrity scanning protein DisA with diadenylate cyclase activity
LDGGFLISSDGYVLSSARYFNADIEGVEIHQGLGARHVAAASITKKTNAIAILVSESSIVRLFSSGRLIAEILPELCLMSRFSSHIRSPILSQHPKENIAIISEKSQ